ncbi:MAG: antitoxin [Dermatophilus congolensis]|nr:antitoxin [Dermatophilus congolensis]
MGLMDGLGDKAKSFADQNADKVEQVSDQGLQSAADAANERTGGQHADKVTQAQQAADERIGDNSQ